MVKFLIKKILLNILFKWLIETQTIFRSIFRTRCWFIAGFLSICLFLTQCFVTLSEWHNKWSNWFSWTWCSPVTLICWSGWFKTWTTGTTFYRNWMRMWRWRWGWGWRWCICWCWWSWINCWIELKILIRIVTKSLRRSMCHIICSKTFSHSTLEPIIRC